MASNPNLRIGFVPEHFSTPLHFAKDMFGLEADLIPFPTGTGAMTAALKTAEIDVAIGLTEGFVADLGEEPANATSKPAYTFIGTYVQSPLRWAISVAKKSEIRDVSEIQGKRVGVSRVGSGSYVMSFVLADQRGWLDVSSSPFEVVPLGDFGSLRKGVNEDKSADFFMWERKSSGICRLCPKLIKTDFTTKAYYDDGTLRRIGEIYTPWPSWMIVARDDTDPRLRDFTAKLNQGITHFRQHKEVAINHIISKMKYSSDDAETWMKTVEFSDDVRQVRPEMLEEVVGILRKASVLGQDCRSGESMICGNGAKPNR